MPLAVARLPKAPLWHPGLHAPGLFPLPSPWSLCHPLLLPPFPHPLPPLPHGRRHPRLPHDEGPPRPPFPTPAYLRYAGPHTTACPKLLRAAPSQEENLDHRGNPGERSGRAGGLGAEAASKAPVGWHCPGSCVRPGREQWASGGVCSAGLSRPPPRTQWFPAAAPLQRDQGTCWCPGALGKPHPEPRSPQGPGVCSRPVHRWDGTKGRCQPRRGQSKPSEEDEHCSPPRKRPTAVTVHQDPSSRLHRRRAASAPCRPEFCHEDKAPRSGTACPGSTSWEGQRQAWAGPGPHTAGTSVTSAQGAGEQLLC